MMWRILFVVRQVGRVQLAPADHAHHQHVRVIPMAGTGEAGPGFSWEKPIDVTLCPGVA